jgi:hypothetical protein
VAVTKQEWRVSTANVDVSPTMNSGEEALNKGFSWKWQVFI